MMTAAEAPTDQPFANSAHDVSDVRAKLRWLAAGTIMAVTVPLLLAANLTGNTALTVGALVAALVGWVGAEAANRRASARLRVSEQRFQLAIDGANEGIWDWDIDNDRLYVSPRLRQMFNLPHDVVSSHWWIRRLHPEDRTRFRKAVLDHLAGRTPIFEVEVRLAPEIDPEGRWFLDRGTSLRRSNGRAYRMAGSLGDVTLLKRREMEAAAARTEAERANSAKTTFLAGMSHELRTPLNAIIGFSDVMRHEVLGPQPNQPYTEYVAHIHESGQMLLALINDLLDLSAIESGRFDLDDSTFDLTELIEGTLQLMTPAAQRRSVSLGRAQMAPLHIIADARRIKQVLLNLLSNAVKYTPSNGSVHVDASSGPTGIRLAITDTGHGIAPEELDTIWRPYTRAAASRGQAAESTGLGLWLCRNIVERHGGTILIDSAVDRGTTVEVLLPPERLYIQSAAAETV